jgi:prolyl-tRNA editing enzyme YbaK/EbsC (Cys-tRNA(Pro) deacylase)
MNQDALTDYDVVFAFAMDNEPMTPPNMLDNDDDLKALVNLPDSARRVALLLRERGHDKRVVMLPQTGKTSAEAAAGLGCLVAQIAKSILFRRREDDAPVLVIASGANRVDEAKVAREVGAIGRADAQFVRDKTGYAIGGVCPIGHATTPVTLIDSDLLQFDSLWAAAGHPHAVFNLSPDELIALTGAPVVDVALRD